MKHGNPMKVVIPMADGVFCEHFGGAQEFLVIAGDQLDDGDLFTAPEHKPGALPKWLMEQKVDALVASAIGERALILLADAGIEVFLANGTTEPFELASAICTGSLLRANLENTRCRGHHDHEGHECHHH